MKCSGCNAARTADDHFRQSDEIPVVYSGGSAADNNSNMGLMLAIFMIFVIAFASVMVIIAVYWMKKGTISLSNLT